MDEHAADHHLAHWSCVSTKSNEWWIRKDGEEFRAFAHGFTPGGYPAELAAFDEEYPMNVTTQTPT